MTAVWLRRRQGFASRPDIRVSGARFGYSPLDVGVVRLGMVLGAELIARFPLAEKRRHDALRLIEEVKQWQ